MQNEVSETGAIVFNDYVGLMSSKYNNLKIKNIFFRKRTADRFKNMEQNLYYKKRDDIILIMRWNW